MDVGRYKLMRHADAVSDRCFPITLTILLRWASLFGDSLPMFTSHMRSQTWRSATRSCGRILPTLLAAQCVSTFRWSTGHMRRPVSSAGQSCRLALYVG